MSSQKRSWSQQQRDDDDDVRYDDLQDEVAAFEEELWSPVTPLSNVESIHEQSSAAGTSALPAETKKKGKGEHSDMNEHFTKSVGNDGKVTARCNHCSTTTYKNVQGTSNLHYHMKKEHPSKLQNAVKVKSIPPAFRAKQKDEPQIMSKKETSHHTNNLTEWIVCTAKPISTVDEPRFVKLINGLNASYKVLFSILILESLL